jgi:hypothetical protein
MYTFSGMLTIDGNLHGPTQNEVLTHISKLTKLFKMYASERPFDFLLMPNTPLVIHVLLKICRDESEQLNKPAEEMDEEKMATLVKVLIAGIETTRSILVAVANPDVFQKGISRRVLIRNRIPI